MIVKKKWGDIFVFILDENSKITENWVLVSILKTISVDFYYLVNVFAIWKTYKSEYNLKVNVK